MFTKPTLDAVMVMEDERFLFGSWRFHGGDDLLKSPLTDITSSPLVSVFGPSLTDESLGSVNIHELHLRPHSARKDSCMLAFCLSKVPRGVYDTVAISQMGHDPIVRSCVDPGPLFRTQILVIDLGTVELQFGLIDIDLLMPRCSADRIRKGGLAGKGQPTDDNQLDRWPTFFIHVAKLEHLRCFLPNVTGQGRDLPRRLDLIVLPVLEGLPLPHTPTRPVEGPEAGSRPVACRPGAARTQARRGSECCAR